jgi:hypothetical protein
MTRFAAPPDEGAGHAPEEGIPRADASRFRHRGADVPYLLRPLRPLRPTADSLIRSRSSEQRRRGARMVTARRVEKGGGRARSETSLPGNVEKAPADP